jgi:hypothetical protein
LISLLASLDDAAGKPSSGSERGYGGCQCLHDILESMLGRLLSTAFTMVRPCLWHDLVSMEPGFPMTDDPNMHEDLIQDFDDAAAAMVDIISAQDVMNWVFD